MIRGVLGRGMGGEKGGEACEVFVKPGLKGKPGRERGGGGKANPLSRGSRVGQSVRVQLGEGGGGEENESERVISMVTWSEPVKGRGVSQA